MRVEMWTDYVCPYSYIGTTELFREIAKRNLSVEIVKRAYLLHPEAPIVHPPTIWESFLQEDGSETAARAHLEDLEHLASEGNVNLHLPDALCPNTINAHRLTRFAAEKLDPISFRALIGKIYHAVFVENLRISNPALLLQIAAECGLDFEETEAMLASGVFRDTVFRDTEAGDQLLDVIPYFRAENGSVLTGRITPEKISRFLLELAA